MNKKLKPWFIAAIICAGIELLITLCVLFTSNSYELTFGWGTFFMFPWHAYPATAVIWCVCGFIGTAIEIRKDRPRALPIVLAILPVLYVIPVVYMYVTYRPSSIMPGLSGLGIAFAWLNYGLPAVSMIVWDIVLIILRCRKNYDFHKSSDSTVCFTKRKGVYIAVVIICAAVPVLTILGVLGYDRYKDISYETEQNKTNDEAMMYYNAADERIDYSNSGDMTDTLFDTQTRRSTALISYDEMRVSFMFWDSIYNDTLKTYLLEPMTFPPSDDMKFVCPLSGKGKEFKAYYKPGDWPAIATTTYITVELADGSLWGVDTGGEVLDFEGSPCPKIAEALEHSDELIPYGKNSAAEGSLFPVYSMGIERNTFGLDHSTMTAYVIYCDGGNTWQDVGYKKDTGEISVTDFRFEPYDGDVADFVPQAVIPLGSPDEYIVPFQTSYSNTWGSCAGVLLYTAIGCYISGEMSYPWYFDFDTSEYALTEDEIADYMYGEYLNLDTSDNLIVYAKKIGDEKDDWRCAFAAYYDAPEEGKEILDMKYISFRSASQIIKHYSQTQNYNVVGVDKNGKVYNLPDDEYEEVLRDLGLEEIE